VTHVLESAVRARPVGVTSAVNDQGTVNSPGKRNIRMQNPVDCRSLPISSNSYRDARVETPPRLRGVLTGQGLRVATFSTDPQTKSRKHQRCAKQPHHAEHSGTWALVIRPATSPMKLSGMAHERCDLQNLSI
jgi:hypothetical protein